MFEKLKSECWKLRSEVKINENMLKKMQEMINKQNKDISNLEKANVEYRKKYEQK